MRAPRKFAAELFLSIFLGGKSHIDTLQRPCQPAQRIPLQEVFENFKNGFLRRKDTVELAELDFLLLEIGNHFCADFAFGIRVGYLGDYLARKSYIKARGAQTLTVLVFYGLGKIIPKFAVLNVRFCRNALQPEHHGGYKPVGAFLLGFFEIVAELLCGYAAETLLQSGFNDGYLFSV